MSKKTTFLLLVLIILGGIWVRTYHHTQWLFFKWDQARDALLLAPAIQHGPEHLPLLGPRATKIGDEYLRLGPIYYYIQYATGVLLHSIEPPVFSYSDLFFNILAIYLFYLFLRLYFNCRLSLYGTLLFTFSFLVVQHSRFAWNPNSVPFFTLLTFYGLLRFSVGKNFKERWRWFSVWLLAYTIASQYHFFAFFVLTGVSALFFCYYFLNKYVLPSNHQLNTASINSKAFRELKESLPDIFKQTIYSVRKDIFSKQFALYLLSILIIVGTLYTPVLISEVKTGGSNSKLFLKMFSASGRNDKTFWQKLQRNFREQGDNYCLITTGFKHRAGFKTDPLTVGSGLFLIVSALWLIRQEIFFKKDNPLQRNFLVLLFLWITVFFIITIPASYQLRPRYFAPVFPLPFVIIVLWYSVLQKRLVGPFRLVIPLVTLLILFLNIYNIYLWFDEQNRSQFENFKTYRTLILRHRDGITLGQLQRTTEYLLQEQNKSQQTIYYSTDTEYYLPFKYLFYLQDNSLEGTPRAVKNSADLLATDIVYVINNDRNGPAGKKLRPYLEEISKKQIGQIFIHKSKVIKKTELLTDLQKKELSKAKKTNGTTTDKTKENAKTNTARLFWRDIFGTDDNLQQILPTDKISPTKIHKN